MKRPFSYFLIALLLFAAGSAQAQWRQLGGLVSAEVIAIVEGAEGVMLAGDRCGQLYRSEDGGETWQPGPSLPQPTIFGQLDTCERDLVGLWYQASTQTLWAAQTPELFRSTDNGRSWTRAASTLESNFCYQLDQGGCFQRPALLDVLPQADGTLLIAHEAGVVHYDPANPVMDRAPTSGIPWLLAQPESNAGLPARLTCTGDTLQGENRDLPWEGGVPSLDATVRDLIADETGQAFAGTRDGVYQWNPDQTWTNLPLSRTDRLGQPLPILDTGIGGLAIRPASGNLYAGIRGSTCTDTLRATESQVYALFGSSLSQQTTGDARPLLKLDFDEQGTLHATTASGLLLEKEFDSNTSLVPVPGLPTIRYNALLRNSEDRLFVGTTGGGGIYRRLPGGAWNNVGGGLAQTEINFLVTGRTGEIVAAQAEGIFRSTDNGTTWTNITPQGVTGTLQDAVIDTTRNLILLPYDRGQILRSRDGGATWPDILTGLPGTFERMFSTPNGDLYARIMGTLTQEVYRSQDGGSTWSPYQLPGTNQNLLISLQGRADGVLFMGAAEGVFRSADQGQNWTKLPDGPFGWVEDFGFFPGSEDLYVRDFSDVYYWSDQEGSWQEATPDIPIERFRNGPLTVNESGDVYISIPSAGLRGDVNIGLLRRKPPHGTATTMESWEQVCASLTCRTAHLKVTPQGDLLAGTEDNGLFILENPDPPRLRFPAKDQISVPANPVFGWNAGANAGPNPNYRFQLQTRETFETEGFTTPLFETDEQTDTQLTLSDVTLEQGQSYCWQVTLDTGFISNRAVPQCFALYPEQFDLQHERTFGDATRAASFQLVSLPGQVDLSIAPLLQGTQDEDWRVYLETGAEGDDHAIAYRSGDDRFNFQPGRAFWLLSKNTLNISRNAVETVPLSEDEARVFSLPLHDGWNLIGTPFEIAVPWNAVRATNPGADPALWGFQRGWVPATQIEPYQGYYYFNASGAETLNIPYTRTTPADAPQLQMGTGHTAPEVALIPTTFTLSSPYPNPFQDEVHLTYEMGTEGRVTLEVYDVLGRRVRRLVDGVQSVGPHVAMWDGKDDLGRSVANGLYLFKLKAGRRAEVQKTIYRK